jgi:type VI secretion system protein ImpA
MSGMASPQILDFEALLNPIAAEHPAGKDVRYDGTYDAIREARRADDPLDQGDWIRPVKNADWSAVIDLARETLASKSKDLQVAAWLVEALVKRQGFPGLRDGLRLLRELQERFWPCLYPEAEEGELEFRAGPLEWLNERLPVSIKEISVTQPGDGANYSWLRWEESRVMDNLGRRDQAAMTAALSDGKITGEQFDKAVEATPLAYHKMLYEDLNESWEEFERLDRVVDEKFGREPPSLLEIRKAIEACRTLMADIGSKRGGLGPDPGPPGPDPNLRESEPNADGSFSGSLSREMMAPTPQASRGAPARSAPDDDPAGVSIDPQSRADALRRLAAVAAYFRRTEPHSPVSYLVQRAVRWGEMPLEQWLQDVINNEDVLGRVRETLGLKESDPNSGA